MTFGSKFAILLVGMILAFFGTYFAVGIFVWDGQGGQHFRSAQTIAFLAILLEAVIFGVAGSIWITRDRS